MCGLVALQEHYCASIQLIPDVQRELLTCSRTEWARALAWHQAHREGIEGHTACYEDEEDSADEENLEDEVNNLDGVYVWVEAVDALQTYVPAFECDEDALVAKCTPWSKDDSDTESMHGRDADARSREGKEPATDTPSQLRVLLHRQAPKATTEPLPTRPAGEMDPRGVHSAPPPDHRSIRAAEKTSAEDKVVSIALHIHSLYGDGRSHQHRLNPGLDMTAAWSSAALTQEWNDVLHDLRQRQSEGTFYLGGHDLQ
ncbi:hypothetical protein CYMTET_10861 [Cymbomonas tetramitiformis]|uniref:Uncharacterized protein n=1 Tax=Cymbomonas tetramitiformis TaxID=36881 RepID=A0AAE0LE21_9CHLO|nr:hypothetical protein CYMTET_10861 [Cymbomonas tetramitiformis]